MKLADSHAHLNHPDFAVDIDRVAPDLVAKKYEVLNVAYDIGAAETALALATRYPNMRASVGIHPHDAESITEDDFRRIEELGRDERVVAIGETGLDYFRNRSPKEAQKTALVRHLEIAGRIGKPVILHCRDAFADIVPLLKQHWNPATGGVLHCFSEGADEARIGVAMGFHISFAGNVTYKKADRIKSAAKVVPSGRLLVETDCPYLAPQSVRGKRNEPSYMIETVKELAALRETTPEDIARVTWVNYRRLFLGIEAADGEVVYQIRDALYVNVTNDCSNLCTFCPRFDDPVVQGHYLGLKRDPTADEILSAIGDARPAEVVLCGFGEPTLRLDVVKEIAAACKKRGLKVRLNTNGQASLIHGRDVLPELVGLIDAVSVSLNAADRETYNRLCRPTSPEKAFDEVCVFIRRSAERLPETVATAVDLPEDVDPEEIRRLAEKLGATFRLRSFNMTGENDGR